MIFGHFSPFLAFSQCLSGHDHLKCFPTGQIMLLPHPARCVQQFYGFISFFVDLAKPPIWQTSVCMHTLVLIAGACGWFG